jgi:hypothetical protein
MESLGIVGKLSKIQADLKVNKDKKNTFGNYMYRSAESILEGIKPFIKDLNAVVVLSDEIVQVANRVYVKATATISFEEGSLSVSAFARESEEKKGMDSAQVTGAASSYARKYAMQGLFAIDDGEDADSQENSNGETKVKTAPKVSPPLKTADDFDRFHKELSAAQGVGKLEDIKKRIKASALSIEDKKRLAEKYRQKKADLEAKEDELRGAA